MGNDPASGDRVAPWTSSHIVVIGEMGVGKTETGSRLAEITGRAHFDSDEMLERSTGTTGACLADSGGVETLHGIELRLFLQAMGRSEPAVISPAASVIDSDTGREAMRGSVVVWLDVPVEVALARIETGDHRRPVGLDEASRLRRRRLSLYRQVSDFHIEPGEQGPGAIAREIARWLRTQREG